LQLVLTIIIIHHLFCIIIIIKDLKAHGILTAENTR